MSNKKSILVIHKDCPEQYILFRAIDDGIDVDLSKYHAEYWHLTPQWNEDYTFRIRKKGKSYKGYITTRGELVVRTYKDYNQ